MPETERTRRAIADVEEHVRSFFTGHEIEALDYDLGEQRREAVPGLRVITVGPGPRTNSWTYVTAGCQGFRSLTLPARPPEPSARFLARSRKLAGCGAGV